MGRYLLIFFTSLLFSLLSMVVLRRWALRTRILAVREIALVGGIGIGCSVVVSCALGFFLFGIDPARTVEIVAVSLAMLIFGIMDDLKEASVVKKFILQSACAVLLILTGVRTHIVYLNDGGNCLVTYLWIIGITNAFNLLDVMDGLSAGAALTVTGALFVLSFFAPDVDLGILTLGLFASILGFLVFNVPPARIYLGNAGSHFLGLMLAALALGVRYARNDHPLALLSPLVLFGIPLLETMTLIYFRLSKRLIPFHKSNDHMAFRLVALGLPRWGALILLGGVSLFFACCGIALSCSRGVVSGMLLFMVLLVSVILLGVLMKAACHE